MNKLVKWSISSNTPTSGLFLNKKKSSDSDADRKCWHIIWSYITGSNV